MYVQKFCGCFTSRIMLLVWSYLRLAVSVLWTTEVMGALIFQINYVSDEILKDPEFIMGIMLHPVFLIGQLIQTAMLITLIIAGHKKNVILYRVYYVYAMIDFVVYLLVVVFSCFIVSNPIEYFYMSFHTLDFFDKVIISPREADLITGMSFLTVICFEVYFLWLLKKIITDISQRTKNGSEISSGCATKNVKTFESV